MKRIDLILIITGAITGIVFSFIIYDDLEAHHVDETFLDSLKITWKHFDNIERLGKMVVPFCTVSGGLIGWIFGRVIKYAVNFFRKPNVRISDRLTLI